MFTPAPPPFLLTKGFVSTMFMATAKRGFIGNWQLENHRVKEVDIHIVKEEDSLMKTRL